MGRGSGHDGSASTVPAPRCSLRFRVFPPAPARGRAKARAEELDAAEGSWSPEDAGRRIQPPASSPPGSHQRVAVAGGSPGVPGPGHAVVQQQVFLCHRHEDRPPLLPPSVQAHLRETRGHGEGHRGLQAPTAAPAPRSPCPRPGRPQASGSTLLGSQQCPCKAVQGTMAGGHPEETPLLGPSSPRFPGRLRLSGSEFMEKRGGDEHLQLGNPNRRGD